MAIAPITGILRKKLYTDIVISFALGTAGAYAYWYDNLVT
ncbi:2777_t:CDS:2 [Entrophospora sp. SA101]|nr:4430_t:CDS:2 [Entrophospora sp. SA101]CAJ0637110.1 2777_t:CDS:2 [Entrophospora sp. SA101]CAJ0825305.1 2495_t:CDS:2 [Entrophospora sp. SA101]CAJ0829517.1 11061_t:CDS:2 [Entrophospora sp. SA101]